jgi:hypothetical protein
MTIRSIFPPAVLLLMICSTASAAGSPQATEGASLAANHLAQPNGGIVLDESTHCSSSSDVSRAPALIPAPEERATLPCGACSLPACQGKNVGDFCGIINGTFVHCVWSSFCGSGPGTGRLCDCSTPVETALAVSGGR